MTIPTALSIGMATLLVAACAADASVTGVNTPLAACTNAVEPRTFRLVLSSGDTLPRIVNRYLEPHRNADTVVVPLGGGVSMRVITTYAVGYCVTALDSTVFRTANARTWVE